MNADALFVRGLCLYHEDNIDKAQQHFRQVLKFNPDHKKARETFKVGNDNYRGNLSFKRIASDIVHVKNGSGF